MAHRALLALAVAVGGLLAAPHTDPADDPPDIDAARAGLAAYLDTNRPDSPSASTDIPGCPALTLDRLQQALGDAGIDDTIEDWSTVIEQNEYRQVAPDLMGITCGGDADGESHDSDFEMLASVYAVDAGDPDRAQEILDQLGFGVLEIEPADVPGGELASICLDDPEQSLSMCMSFWSHDGFVLGIVLASDVTDIPDGAASAVLEETFPDILATLGDVTVALSPTTDASPESTSPTSTEDSPLDVAGARIGLATLVDDAPDTGPNEPLAECPVVARSVVNGALETAGVDAPLAEWNVEFGPVDTGTRTWDDRGITCTGAYVGAERDESFPELRASLIVVDLGNSATFEQFLIDAYPGATDPLPTPALGGATRGECADVDLTDQCVELWEQDGFVVGILLADRVFMDRPTASAILNVLVPEVVDTLATVPEAEEPAEFTARDEEVEAARAGLSNLVAAGGGSGELEDCPLVAPPAMNDAVGVVGVEVTLDEWSGHVSTGSPGVRCEGSGSRGTVAVHVDDYGDSASANEVIELVHGCERAGDVNFCVESWEQDGLTVTVSVTASGVERDAVVGLLEGLVPVVLANLAAGAS